MFSRAVIVIVYLAFIGGCTSPSNNTVGAAYDADSSYCRELVKGEVRIQGDFTNPAPSSQDLYERHCEPIGAWLARDPEGHKSTVAIERSLFGQLLDKIF